MAQNVQIIKKYIAEVNLSFTFGAFLAPTTLSNKSRYKAFLGSMDKRPEYYKNIN